MVFAFLLYNFIPLYYCDTMLQLYFLNFFSIWLQIIISCYTSFTANASEKKRKKKPLNIIVSHNEGWKLCNNMFWLILVHSGSLWFIMALWVNYGSLWLTPLFSIVALPTCINKDLYGSILVRSSRATIYILKKKKTIIYIYKI